MINAKFLREAALLPIAAVALGLAYNTSSPLGVRWHGAPALADSTKPVSEVAATHISTPTVELPDPDLFNETITADIVSGGVNDHAGEAPRKSPAGLKWSEVKPLLERQEVVVLDGRDSLAYEAGHIPGAISLPLRLVSEKIGELAAKYPKNTPLVIYCAAAQCAIARQEAALLGEQGYTDVREMPGGYAEWLAAEGQDAVKTGGQP